MAETRTAKITAVMTPSQRDRFQLYADEHKWSLSTALVDLALKALAAEQNGSAER